MINELESLNSDWSLRCSSPTPYLLSVPLPLGLKAHGSSLGVCSRDWTPRQLIGGSWNSSVQAGPLGPLTFIIHRTNGVLAEEEWRLGFMQYGSSGPLKPSWCSQSKAVFIVSSVSALLGFLRKQLCCLHFMVHAAWLNSLRLWGHPEARALEDDKAI